MAKQSTAQQELPDSVNEDMDQLESVVEFSEDISNAERPEPLPVSEYHATILKFERKVGKESGRPYAQVQYQIDASDMPADYVEKYQIDKKILIGRHQVLEDNPKARYNMRRYCEAVGAPMSNRIAYDAFTGLTCKISVDHQDDLEGNPVENVRSVKRT